MNEIIDDDLPSIAADIVDRVHSADSRMRERSPFYRRLLAGEVDADEYAAWLVQMHKYIRSIERIYRAGASALAPRSADDVRGARIREYTSWVVDEESGHDDLLVSDLATLWRVSDDEVLGRIEREPSAPSNAVWAAMTDVMLARYPVGLLGFAVAMESFALLQTDEIRAHLLERGEILLIDEAVRFLAAHSSANEAEHTQVGRRHVDLLVTPEERAAALFFGHMGVALFEGIVQFLDQRVPVAMA